MIKKIRNFKFVIRNCQAGMTYVELIVVLSIFAIMTSIVLFNYNGFQAKVDIKVLANDIAIKIVEAQKASIAGDLLITPPSSSWKPSYGVYFNSANANKNKFIYFANGGSDNVYDTSTDTALSTISITKNNYIQYLHCSGIYVDNLSVVFRRPDSSAQIIFDNGGSEIACTSGQITISSPGGITSVIKVDQSGRIQIN